MMRIFALETDPGELLTQFVVENEKVLLATACHWTAFLFPFLLTVFVTGVMLVLVLPFLFLWSMLLGVGALILVVMLCFLFTANAYIRWKYNFLIVTTEQVISVIQRSFFYNAITPTPIDNINSARVESSFMGIFNVGVVHLSLRERVEASSREITLTHMPRPNEISSVIENAIVLAKQREFGDESFDDQRGEARRIAESTRDAME